MNDPHVARPCRRNGCKRPARGLGEKYCRECAEIVLRRLRGTGYLTPEPAPSREGSRSSRWDDRMLPGQENAIRNMEGD